MKTVHTYTIHFYGGPNGYQTNRCQITLFDSTSHRIGFVRFNDPDMFYEDDYENSSGIRMHMPSDMYQPVIDMLRNEKPVYMYFSQGRAFLGTSNEPAGEDDRG